MSEKTVDDRVRELEDKMIEITTLVDTQGRLIWGVAVVFVVSVGTAFVLK